jgi:hypothetical protein
MCGMPIFSTARVPSARTTAATYEQLTSSPSNGASSVSDHLCSKSRSTSGRRSSHAARCGVLWQLAASPSGIHSAMPVIVAASLVVSSATRRWGSLRGALWPEVISDRRYHGLADRCTEETAYSTGTESVARALEVLVNQYDWLRSPLTVRVVKRLKFSAVGMVGDNTVIKEPLNLLA